MNRTRRSIHVRVSPAGEITVEARGFAGKGCEAATAAIEAALGSARHRTRKPEFWRRELRSRSENTQRLGDGAGEGPP